MIERSDIVNGVITKAGGKLVKAESDGSLIIHFVNEEGEPDSYGDVFAAGSVKSQQAQIAFAQFKHSDNLPVGWGQIYVERGQGLWRGQLDLVSDNGAATYRYIQNGGPSVEYSFRAFVLEYSIMDTGGLRYIELDTYEVSLVFRGAGIGTHTISMESKEPVIERVETEELIVPKTTNIRAKAILALLGGN